MIFSEYKADLGELQKIRTFLDWKNLILWILPLESLEFLRFIKQKLIQKLPMKLNPPKFIWNAWCSGLFSRLACQSLSIMIAETKNESHIEATVA